MAEGHGKLKMNPAPSQVRVKQEKEGYDVQDGRSHHFKFQFRGDVTNYTLNPGPHATVLGALKTHPAYNARQYKDENVVITLSMQDRQVAVATHFPCHLIEDDKVLEIYQTSKKVEEIKPGQDTQSQGRYVTFFIHKIGGANTTGKKPLKHYTFREVDYLCIYAEEKMTVGDALKRDGRFIDNLSNFNLSDEADSDSLTFHSQSVEMLDGKFFKICLPRGQGPENKIAKSIISGEKGKTQTQQKNQEASHDSQNSSKKSGAEAFLNVVSRSGRSADVEDEEIFKLLPEQFPHLQKLMESQFPANSFQKTLNQKKETFHKSQQAFSEVHRVRQLLEWGKSVCQIIVKGTCKGTGFILFDNFILTNGHLFKKGVAVQRQDKWEFSKDVWARFNYEDPSGTNWYEIKVKKTITDFCFTDESQLDYAILELDPDTLTVGPDTQAPQAQQKPNIELPPGLLQICGPVPENGEACIIGHPAGHVKQMDATCIIEKVKREQAADSRLKIHNATLFAFYPIIQKLEKRGIKNIMLGGSKEGDVVTYSTFMYHGSSGSPVFDADCRVFGLHSAGFTYKFSKAKYSAIEFAHPLIDILKNFLMNPKRDQELLERVRKAVESIEVEEVKALLKKELVIKSDNE